MCTHGTLLVCHVQVGVGLGWGCNLVSGSCTHAGCYATATLVCELPVFYVNMVRQTACMANRVKWIRCKLQVIVDFSARFGEKKWRLDIVKTFNDQLHLKTWYAVYFWKHTFYMEKHSKINTMTTRTTNGCGYSSHVVTVDLVPAWANPPGGANMLQVIKYPPGNQHSHSHTFWYFWVNDFSFWYENSFPGGFFGQGLSWHITNPTHARSRWNPPLGLLHDSIGLPSAKLYASCRSQGNWRALFVFCFGHVQWGGWCCDKCSTLEVCNFQFLLWHVSQFLQLRHHHIFFQKFLWIFLFFLAWTCRFLLAAWHRSSRLVLLAHSLRALPNPAHCVAFCPLPAKSSSRGRWVVASLHSKLPFL